VLENKQNREMTDSADLTISVAYGQRCETFRFASRKIRFVFAVLGPIDARNEMLGSGQVEASRHRQVDLLKAYASRSNARRFLAPEGAIKVSTSWRLWSVPFGKLGRALPGGLAAARNEISEMETEGTKELRERAVNPLKSLVSVTLCAGPAGAMGQRRNARTKNGESGKRRFPLN
jgi:hypothetical protein